MHKVWFFILASLTSMIVANPPMTIKKAREIMGFEPTGTLQQSNIQTVFKELSLNYHPDKNRDNKDILGRFEPNTSATDKFQALSKAKELLLKDPTEPFNIIETPKQITKQATTGAIAFGALAGCLFLGRQTLQQKYNQLGKKVLLALYHQWRQEEPQEQSLRRFKFWLHSKFKDQPKRSVMLNEMRRHHKKYLTNKTLPQQNMPNLLLNKHLKTLLLWQKIMTALAWSSVGCLAGTALALIYPLIWPHIQWLRTKNTATTQSPHNSPILLLMPSR